MIKNKMMILKDANGKEFEVKLDDLVNSLNISDLEEGHTLDIYDSESMLENSPKLSIVDSDGNPFDITTINDTEKSKKIVGLDVLIEVTHSGQNANNVFYYSDSMEKDTSTMLAPFKKPFIKNHDSYSDPIGRVKDAYFGPSEFVDRDTINVTFRVTDEDAIPKFMDGRYNTVSIGGTPARVTCDICGKDIIKDGVFKFCGHWKGDTYAGKKATWSCRDITYNEISVVNNPADKWAMVKKITVITEEEVKSSDSEAKDFVGDTNSMITDGIGDNAEANTLLTSILADDKAENKEPDNLSDGNNEPPATEAGEPVKDDEGKPAAEPEKTVEDCLTEIKQLNETIETLKSEKKTLSDSLETVNAENAEIKDKLVATEAESKVARDQSLRMAVKYKALLVDSVKTIATMAKSDLKDADIESKSIKELSALSDELKTKIPVIHATPTPATNPGVVDNKAPNVLPDVKDKETTKTSTVDAYALMNSMIDSAAR